MMFCASVMLGSMLFNDLRFRVKLRTIARITITTATIITITTMCLQLFEILLCECITRPLQISCLKIIMVIFIITLGGKQFIVDFEGIIFLFLGSIEVHLLIFTLRTLFCNIKERTILIFSILFIFFRLFQLQYY